ncbi:Cytochrome P450 94A1 [Camellia lanceoleosa]|uniref:Cytochrome P450 94A1 n=1 Tax=Camellia lanceoleosa TaxID=1840588 RepID=A0ACC0FW74_9ERIC|nr:Cytochrome P450 94A1 [Camellia lanceoleosa]
MSSTCSSPISISTKRAQSLESMSGTYLVMASLMSMVRTGSSRDKFPVMYSPPNLYTNLSRSCRDRALDRLIPIFFAAPANKTVLDLQDILQRFAFDNICKIAFGHDLAYLQPSIPQEKFAVAFETAVLLSSQRSNVIHPVYWKIK